MTMVSASVGRYPEREAVLSPCGVSSWMRWWNRNPAMPSTKLSSIFIATGTIYRLKSGLNLSVATSAPKRGL